eukprot:IDg13290t1
MRDRNTQHEASPGALPDKTACAHARTFLEQNHRFRAMYVAVSECIRAVLRTCTVQATKGVGRAQMRDSPPTYDKSPAGTAVRACVFAVVPSLPTPHLLARQMPAHYTPSVHAFTAPHREQTRT